MFDNYVIKYITDYLNQCNKCNQYDINDYNQICIICKNFYCNKCKKYLIRNYNDYETTSNYCQLCNDRIFYHFYN